MSSRTFFALAIIATVLIVITRTTTAEAQDAEVSCSWVGQRQACHTIDEWEKMARLWCDRYQAAKAAASKSKHWVGEPTPCTGPQEAQNLRGILRSKPIRFRSAAANNKD